jgi:hypothetical protein
MITRRTLYGWLGAGVVASVLGGVFLRHYRRTGAQAAAGRCTAALKADAAKWTPIEHQSVVPAAFPLHPVEGRRYLIDAAARPFLIVGDSAWSLLTQLRTEDAELYLGDRQAKGFNTLLVNLIEHRFADNAPKNVYGDSPFKQDGDLSTANDRYFDHAERVLRSASQKGFLVLLAPAYTGAEGGNDGWYHAMQACGPDKLRDYGRYVGNRFKDFRNIIWVHAGDFSPPDKTLSKAVADGIRDILPDSLHTVHNAPELHGLGYWSANEIPIAIDTLYSYAPIVAGAETLAANRKIPFFLIESRYELDRDGTPWKTRGEAWQAVLQGAAGQVFGNNAIWCFNAAEVQPPPPMTWKEALNSPGSFGISHLRDLLLSLPWSSLEPDLDGKLLVDGALSGLSQAVAAQTEDRKLAIVYLPSPRPFVVDLKQFAGEQVTARWFDPADGQFFNTAPEPLSTSGRHELNAPGCSTDGDWVLLLSASAE